MPVNKDTRDRLGYVRFAGDTEGECFYCGEKPEKLYNDYIPPRDVAKDPELRAMVTTPFVYVTTCHQCKSNLYIHRYRLRTPEERKLHMVSKGLKRRTNYDDIKKQLGEESIKPWQVWSTDAMGNKAAIDISESELPSLVLAAKAAWVAQNFAVAQTSEEIAPRTEDVQVSGPKSDVQSATDIDLGF